MSDVLGAALEVVGSVREELSAPAVVLAGTAADAAIPLLQQGVAASVVGETVGAAVADLAGAVPVVGFFVSVATAIINIAAASREQREAEKRATCQAEFQRRKVVPSGSKLGGCEQCPTDLFRRSGPYNERSLLGQTLVAVTEGAWMDSGNKAVAPGWTATRYDEARYAMIAERARTGLSRSRREKYRKLRLAMEHAFVEPGGPPSDGGVSLWPAYLDMILNDVDRKRITLEYVELCVSAGFMPKVLGKHTLPPNVPTATYGKDGALMEATNQRQCYVPALPTSFFSLVSGWRDSIRPRYEEGKRALREMQAVAEQFESRDLVSRLKPTARHVLPALAATAVVGVAVARPGLVRRALEEAARLARHAASVVRR